jgi:AraC family transcriptional regulator of adaptative response/methylated-DNA-[protein]-cysteine methyltransferase
MIYAQNIHSPLGTILACCDEVGITLLKFEIEAPEIKPHPFLAQLENELAEYFSGKRREFSVPLHPRGTAFQESVWKSLQAIPYGKTWSYQEQSEFIKHPKAIRAMAQANGANPISIILPCHRVIGKNGQLTGYAGGLERKRWLLELEGFNLR